MTCRRLLVLLGCALLLSSCTRQPALPHTSATPLSPGGSTLSKAEEAFRKSDFQELVFESKLAMDILAVEKSAPENIIRARVLLAEGYAGQKDFTRSRNTYEALLKEKPQSDLQARLEQIIAAERAQMQNVAKAPPVTSRIRHLKPSPGTKGSSESFDLTMSGRRLSGQPDGSIHSARGTVVTLMEPGIAIQEKGLDEPSVFFIPDGQKIPSEIIEGSEVTVRWSYKEVDRSGDRGYLGMINSIQKIGGRERKRTINWSHAGQKWTSPQGDFSITFPQEFQVKTTVLNAGEENFAEIDGLYAYTLSDPQQDIRIYLWCGLSQSGPAWTKSHIETEEIMHHCPKGGVRQRTENFPLSGSWLVTEFNWEHGVHLPAATTVVTATGPNPGRRGYFLKAYYPAWNSPGKKLLLDILGSVQPSHQPK